MVLKEKIMREDHFVCFFKEIEKLISLEQPVVMSHLKLLNHFITFLLHMSLCGGMLQGKSMKF